MPRRKKLKLDDASNALDAFAAPKPKQKSALEQLIERDFDKLLKAIDSGYSLSEICATLSKFGISSSPKVLKAALYSFAAENDRLANLPAQFVPPPPEHSPEMEQSKEPEPEQTEPQEESSEEMPDELKNMLDRAAQPAASASIGRRKWQEPEFNVDDSLRQ